MHDLWFTTIRVTFKYWSYEVVSLIIEYHLCGWLCNNSDQNMTAFVQNWNWKVWNYLQNGKNISRPTFDIFMTALL